MRANVPLGVHLSSALYKLLLQPSCHAPGRRGGGVHAAQPLGVAGLPHLTLADLQQLDTQLAATCRTILATPDVEGGWRGGGAAPSKHACTC